MSTTVSIDGYKLEPAPLITVNKVYNRLNNNTPISAYFNITVNFTIVTDRGSPRSKIDGTISNTGWGGPDNYFWTATGYATPETISSDQRLAAMIRKQEALRLLFSSYVAGGHHLEVQSADGSYPLKADVTLQDMNFAEGIWFNTCNCSLVLRATKVTILGETYDEDYFSAFPYLIESFSENWQFETDEIPESQSLPRTYKTTHTLQCKGINKYNTNIPPSVVSPAWIQAKQAVLNGIFIGGITEDNSHAEYAGISPWSNYLNKGNFMPLSGVRDLPSYYLVSNHLRTENLDKTEGTYGITETWILSSGRSLFDWTIQKTDDIKNPVTTVTINGTITGLDERDPVDLSLMTSKYANAETRLSGEIGNFHQWCQSYAGVSLNPLPTSKTIGKNPNTGVISVDYSYDNRPTYFLNGGSGVRYEEITIGYSRQGDVFASIPVIGRTQGPVLQGFSTKTARRKTLNISAILDPQSTLSLSYPDVSPVIDAVTPTGTFVFSEPAEETLTVTGQYNYSRAWTYEE